MKKNKIVLYIEDNPVNLDLVVRFLDKYPDISVISCKTAEEGLKLTSNQHPDLVLLDINLPGMSGYEMLDQLKNDETLTHIPVVALTADVMMQDIENGFASGFDDYLTKPLDLEIFRSTILGFLNTEYNDKA
ncbi:MAG: response regulator [Gammaproteobacteria bacterium]|nr:response regulator [Gammaproteobacteria bacterium]